MCWKCLNLLYLWIFFNLFWGCLSYFLKRGQNLPLLNIGGTYPLHPLPNLLLCYDWQNCEEIICGWITSVMYFTWVKTCKLILICHLPCRVWSFKMWTISCNCGELLDAIKQFILKDIFSYLFTFLNFEPTELLACLCIFKNMFPLGWRNNNFGILNLLRDIWMSLVMTGMWDCFLSVATLSGHFVSRQKLKGLKIQHHSN